MSKTREQIHYNMQRIKCKDSEIELLLRQALWQKGLRYRKKDFKVRQDFWIPKIERNMEYNNGNRCIYRTI